MEFVSYNIVGQETASLNTGSYLNRTEYSLFVKGISPDLWYGYSANDVIELGVFDRDQTFLSWSVLDQTKTFRDTTLSFLNALDFPVTYSFAELITDFILFKNEKILVNPVQELSSSFGILDGSYFLTYNFARNMAGDINNPIIIKEISPSRKELKLVPLSSSTVAYNAFCNKKVLMRDVSPLYLQSIKTCPISQIYSQISPLYVDEINTIKSLFFFNTDGAIVNFIKNFYEDVIIFSSTSQNDAQRIIRIQGIRTFFSNYLLSNSDKIVDFPEIDTNFNGFVSASIERKFAPIGPHPAEQYVKAKTFLYSFFTKYFYQPISDVLSRTYNEKYYSHLKNALNFGGNRLLLIIDHNVMDERITETDPLTLIVKLQSELPNDIMARSQCWVTNIALAPYVVNAIVKNPSGKITHAIGPPNFSLPIPNVSLTNTNLSYTAADLQTNSEAERELTVSRNLAQLNVNYTDFQNFVIFSSAELRLKIFKNKIIQFSTLSSSLNTLNTKNTNFLMTSGSTYPFYTEEHDSIQTQVDDIVNSFDGYESYLYRGGSFTYSSGFVSSSFVAELDASASAYDKTNRDSLINNCPEYILVDPDNDDYLIFLSMVGHFFDQIFAYVSNIPSEKRIGHSTTQEFTRRIVDYMLETFGWQLDDSLEQANLINNYLTSDQISSLNEMSAEDRLKSVRNRLLINLPQIYKTKGTDEAVKLLLACYGIPSTLLSIREYGGVNYTDETATYTTFERSYMYQWDTSSKDDYFRTGLASDVNTYLLKVSIDDATPYTYGKEQILIGSVISGSTPSSISGSGQWAIGFVRDPQKNTGRVFFRIGYKGAEQVKIFSPRFPLFDGNIYSIMVRRDLPDVNFETASNVNVVPATYDLVVKRNDSGRQVISISSSTVVYSQSIHETFNVSSSYLMIGGWFSTHNGQGYTGTMDKVQVWLDPLTDSNFEDYTNNINSYSFSGSIDAFQSLLFRMHTDYPFDLRQIAPNTPLTASKYFDLTGSNQWVGIWRNANPYYAVNSYTKQALQSVVAPANMDYLVSVGAWSGSQKLVFDSASCQFISQSTYPFQFKIIDYPTTIGISKYGPNKFRNEKLRHLSQSVAARFDDKERSTFVPQNNTAPDSNQVGFFADPQDFKNRDIVRYFGNYDFMNAIGDPGNEFSSSYDTLRLLRKQYADSKNEYSGSKTLFNELAILYKLYFNRSIFEAIRNLAPARANTLVGVLVEPTILERPKYQAKPIFSEVNTGSVFYADVAAVRYFRDTNTKLVRMTQSLEFAEFNLDTGSLLGSYFDSSSLPHNHFMDINLSYLNLPNIIYPVNYLKDGTYVTDLPDNFQMGHFGTNNSLLMDDITFGKIPMDMNKDVHPITGSKFHLLKRWKRYNVYAKTGPWTRTTSPVENHYTSASVYLYDYVVVSDLWFQSNVYTASATDNTDPSDITVGLGNLYRHFVNTFSGSPNAPTNNYQLTKYNNGIRDFYATPVILVDQGEYFEIVGGYPRNHFTHKRDLFSIYRLKTFGNQGDVIVTGSYTRSSQNINTTVGPTGLSDGSDPIQTTQVGNLNLVQADNVINH